MIGGEWKHGTSQTSIFLVVLILIVTQDSQMEWTKSQMETCHYHNYGDFLTQCCDDFYESKRYYYKQKYLKYLMIWMKGKKRWSWEFGKQGLLFADSKNRQKDMESKRRKLSLNKEYLVIFLPKCHD